MCKGNANVLQDASLATASEGCKAVSSFITTVNVKLECGMGRSEGVATGIFPHLNLFIRAIPGYIPHV